VEGATDVPNTASVRVMERIGMSFVRRGLLNGLDTLFYRLTRESYDARRSSQGAKGPEVRRSEGARVPE
jgi:RimJ/RimL family protein N-acetyltransferase